MKILVNGSERPLAEPMTVALLLTSLGLQPRMTVVELNGRVLRPAEFGSCGIADGDRVEIVRFVGGG